MSQISFNYLKICNTLDEQGMPKEVIRYFPSQNGLPSMVRFNAQEPSWDPETKMDKWRRFRFKAKGETAEKIYEWYKKGSLGYGSELCISGILDFENFIANGKEITKESDKIVVVINYITFHRKGTHKRKEEKEEQKEKTILPKPTVPKKVPETNKCIKEETFSLDDIDPFLANG